MDWLQREVDPLLAELGLEREEVKKLVVADWASGESSWSPSREEEVLLGGEKRMRIDLENEKDSGGVAAMKIMAACGRGSGFVGVIEPSNGTADVGVGAVGRSSASSLHPRYTLCDVVMDMSVREDEKENKKAPPAEVVVSTGESLHGLPDEFMKLEDGISAFHRFPEVERRLQTELEQRFGFEKISPPTSEEVQKISSITVSFRYRWLSASNSGLQENYEQGSEGAHLFRDPDVAFKEFVGKREFNVYLCAPVQEHISDAVQLLRNRWLLQGFIGLLFYDNRKKLVTEDAHAPPLEKSKFEAQEVVEDVDLERSRPGTKKTTSISRRDFLFVLHQLTQQEHLPQQFSVLVPRWTYFLEHPVEQTIEELDKRLSRPHLHHLRRRIREASVGLGSTCSLLQAASLAESVVSVGLGIEPDLVNQVENLGREDIDPYIPALSSRIAVLMEKYGIWTSRSSATGLSSSTADEEEEDADEKVQQYFLTRFIEWLEAFVEEIFFLIHSWSTIYGKGNWFSGMIQLEEGRRLIRSLGILQRALTKEFFCKRLEKSAVAFQGEWGTVERAQVNMVYWAVFGGKRRWTTKHGVSAGLPSVKNDSGDHDRVDAVSAKTLKVDAFPTPEIVRSRLLPQIEEQERERNPFFHSVKTQLAEFDGAVGRETRTDSTFAAGPDPKYSRFAFLTVLWSNSPKIYIDAVRTLAHSCYRLHDGRYRFLVIVPADEESGHDNGTTTSARAASPAVDTSYLLRAPNFNLEVYPVSEKMVAPPNWGTTKKGSTASWNWFKERKIAKSAIGFYMFAMEEEFDAIVYLDADTLLIQPIDELFTMVVGGGGGGGGPPFSVATNLMARFSTGGLAAPRGNAVGNVRALWFPYINIACMVTRQRKFVVRVFG
eukprot:g254.t1